MVKYKLFDGSEVGELKIVRESHDGCSSKLLGVFIGIGILIICFLFFIIYSRFLQAEIHREKAKTLNLSDKSEIGILRRNEEDTDSGFIIEDHDLTLSDHLHVIKDYSNNIQIMKISSLETTVCYLAPLNKPQLKTNLNLNKTYSNVVYEVKEIVSKELFHSFSSPGVSKSFRKMLSDLCGSTSIFILDETHSHSTSGLENFKDSSMNSPEPVSVRRKRNIRQCKTSCCYVVCCCDVKHFVFQSDHEFSCVHVCDVCSNRYRKKVQKIC